MTRPDMHDRRREGGYNPLKEKFYTLFEPHYIILNLPASLGAFQINPIERRACAPFFILQGKYVDGF